MGENRECKSTLQLVLIACIVLLLLSSILAVIWRSTSNSESERILITIIPVLSGAILCITSIILYRTQARNRIIEELRDRNNRCQEVCHDMRNDISLVQNKLCNPMIINLATEAKTSSGSNESVQEKSDG